MNLSKFLNFVYSNYFWIITINAFLYCFFRMKQYMLSILFPIVLYALAMLLPSPAKNKKNIYDVLIILIIICSIISWLINDYGHQSILILKHCLGPLSYMMVYFIGKKQINCSSNQIFEQALLPTFITCIVGIYCFFYPPQWYYRAMADGEYASLEALRLHSIFSSPYQLAYMCCFLLGYLFFQKLQNGLKFGKIIVTYVIVYSFTLLLCMMRAPILGTIIFLCGAIFIYLSQSYRKDRYLYVILGLVITFFVIFVGLQTLEKNDFIFYLNEKVEDASSFDFIISRYNLIEAHYSLWGDGAGRHNIWAREFADCYAMPDGEYQKIQQEVGIIGMSIYVILFLLIILKCLYNIKYLMFELCAVIFLLISMIGADPLSTIDKHPMIFWLLIGRVSAFSQNKMVVQQYNKSAKDE